MFSLVASQTPANSNMVSWEGGTGTRIVKDGNASCPAPWTLWAVTVTFRFLINDVQKGSRVLDDQLRRKKFINLLFGI